MSKELEQYTEDPVVQDRLSDALEGMTRLLKDAEQDVASISERVFLQVLLPVLTNRSGKQSLRIWNEIAGHPMRAIEVTDNQSGERLFIIPPLMRGVLAKIPTDRKRMSIYEILQMAEQKRRVIAGMGERFLTEQMGQWKPEEGNEESDIGQWAAILKRYNIDIGVEPADTEDKPTQGSGELSFTGEYDDL